MTKQGVASKAGLSMAVHEQPSKVWLQRYSFWCYGPWM